MKHSKITKVMALMLSLVMITSVFVGNTLSRYVTSVSSADSARVAIWGINGGTSTMNLFDTQYIVDEKIIAKSNNAETDSTDKIIAPGTKGEAAFNIINFEQDVAPEVAYEVKISLDDSAIDERIKNNPSIQWKLDDGVFGTWEQLKTAVLSLSGNETGTYVYGPGEFVTAFEGTQEHKIVWQWLMDNDESVTTQVCDDENNCEDVTMTSSEYNTYLGNLALDDSISAVVAVDITAIQVDDLVTNGYILDGANQTVNINEVEPITIRSSADFSTFDSVEINGQPLTKDTDYTVTEGSTVVTLTEEYLSKLEVGTYTIDIISTNITASTKFNVIEDDIIRITSEEEIFALGRITALQHERSIFKYNSDYSSENDFALFNIPESLITDDEKREYLRTASYKLMNDVDIQIRNGGELDFFTGIGSNHYPFSGEFNGNNKTINLSLYDNVMTLDKKLYIGFFGEIENAKIKNVNIKISDDIIIKEINEGWKKSYKLGLGAVAGIAKSSVFENCNVDMKNVNFGFDYTLTDEPNVTISSVGGIVAFSSLSTYTNCNVTMTNSTLLTKAIDHPSYDLYANFGVGGIIGVSSAGSNNTDNIGRLGNQIYNCNFISDNTVQRDVILAQVETGGEMTAGGLVGSSMNNLLISNSHVNITKGNIVAQKLGTTDIESGHGSQAAGIIGRLEHTGEISGCTVTGNYLNIISKSPQNLSTAGGIVGESIGARHREVTDINNCHFDGSNTSSIKLEITSADNSGTRKYSAAGGLAGLAMRVADSTVKNVTVINNSEGVTKAYIGTVVGYIQNPSKLYQIEGIYNSEFSNVTLENTSNVIDNNYEIND